MADTGQVAIKKRLATMLSKSTAFQAFVGLPDDEAGALARTHTQEVVESDARPLAFIGKMSLDRRMLGTATRGVRGSIEVTFEQVIAVVTNAGEPVLDPDTGSVQITDANWDAFVNAVSAILDEVTMMVAGGILGLGCGETEESLRVSGPVSMAGRDQSVVANVQMAATFPFGGE